MRERTRSRRAGTAPAALSASTGLSRPEGRDGTSFFYDIRDRARYETAREAISDVLVAIEGSAAEVSEEEVRRRLGASPGDGFG